MLVSQGVGLAGVLVAVAARATAPPHLIRLLPAAAAGLGGIVGLAAFYRALAIGTMSIVAPISATGVVVPVIVGVAGGERPAPLQLAGIAAATVGVVLASREHGPGAQTREDSGARFSIALALVAALGFGSFFVGLRSGARADVLWALVASRGVGVAALGAAAAVAARAGRSPLSRGSGRFAALALMGLLDLSANGCYALATRHGLLSVVAVAASLYPLATVLLARVVLGERVRRVQEIGILAALTGVSLIAAG
jgi:drug/metabolite transporter (DMT)-like permease